MKKGRGWMSSLAPKTSEELIENQTKRKDEFAKLKDAH